jgi:hypothetical protein
MVKCSICGKPIVLSPSAKERAAKYGMTPDFYTKLFTTHSECFIKKRAEDTRALLEKLKNER